VKRSHFFNYSRFCIGVSDPVAAPCKMPSCTAESVKPCALHAQLNISVPIEAFTDDELRDQLLTDFHSALPKTYNIAIAAIKKYRKDQVEVEFVVDCSDGEMSAQEEIGRQLRDPTSPLRHGVVTRGTADRFQVISASSLETTNTAFVPATTSNQRTTFFKPSFFLIFMFFVFAFFNFKF
jgi:hypothetical protein